VGLGGVASSLNSLLNESPQIEQVIAKLGGSAGIIDAYFAGVMGLFAIIVAGYAIQATLRMRSEETDKRGEPVLATAVSRWRWAASHLWFAFIGPAVVLAVMGLTTGLIHGINAHDLSTQLPRVLAGAMVQLPAVWVLVGLAVALYGLLPRWTGLSWGALGLVVMILLMDAVVNLPRWVLDISPFTHIPKIPGGNFSPEPLIILVAVALLLTTVGLIGFRRRDFDSV
jgi:ABC-2 type transport system permease protein